MACDNLDRPATSRDWIKLKLILSKDFPGKNQIDGNQMVAAEGTELPGYVEREFEDYLRCGRVGGELLILRQWASEKDRYNVISMSSY